MIVYLVKRKKDPSFNDETRWLITAPDDVELFWEIDKYVDPFDIIYCKAKKRPISLQFKTKKVKPEHEDDLEFEIEMNEEGSDGLYDLIDCEDSLHWKEFDERDKYFYERAYPLCSNATIYKDEEKIK